VVAELATCVSAGELSGDARPVRIGCWVPGPGMPSQLSGGGDSAPTQAPAAEQADIDLRLIQPSGRGLDGALKM
jgi:hypothetical protein